MCCEDFGVSLMSDRIFFVHKAEIKNTHYVFDEKVRLYLIDIEKQFNLWHNIFIPTVIDVWLHSMELVVVVGDMGFKNMWLC